MIEYNIVRASKGKYPYNRGKHILAILNLYAYADESGMHENPLFFVLGGYIASPRQWDFFCKDWQKVLNSFSVHAFHAKDFFQLKARQMHKRYNKWSEDQNRLFISELSKAVNSHKLYPIGCAIDVKAFNSFTIGERRYLTGGNWDAKKRRFTTSGKPSVSYLAAFHYYVRAVLDRTPDKAKLHLVFDYQNVMKSKARQTFNEMAALPSLMQGHEKLDSINYFYSSDKPQLQAADLFTYVTYRYAVDGIPNDYSLGIAMKRLLKDRRSVGLMNTEGIEAFLQKYLPAIERSRIQAKLTTTCPHDETTPCYIQHCTTCQIFLDTKGDRQ